MAVKTLQFLPFELFTSAENEHLAEQPLFISEPLFRIYQFTASIFMRLMFLAPLAANSDNDEDQVM